MRAALPLLLVVIAGAGVTWWLGRGGEPAPVESERAASWTAASESRAVAAPTVGDVPPERRDAAAGEAPAGAPPIPADAVWTDVVVVDRVTRAPVPGADVCWRDDTCDARVEALPFEVRGGYWDDPVRIADAFGWRARTDARGCVRVHVHPEGTVAYARADGRYGELQVATAELVRLRERAIELPLDPDLELLVRVVDAANRAAAGVPVGMDLSPVTRFGGDDTDANGEVRFRHLQQQLGRDDRGACVDAAARVSVRIAGLKETCTAEVSALALPREGVVLTLPPTGEMHVHVLHPGRRVEHVGARFWIGAVDDYDARDDASGRSRHPDGVVRFPFVPLGRTFTVGVEVGDLELHRAVAGPTRAGETIVATFEVPHDAVALTGRLLDEDGRPLANHDAGLALSADLVTSRQNGWQLLATDAGGRFVLHVRAAETPEPGAEAEPIELRAFTVKLRRGPLDVVHAEVAGRTLRPGVNEIGDLRLAPLPLLVSGRVRFDRAPVHASPRFVVERWIDADAERPGWWQAEHELVELTDDEGRFVVRGTTWPGRLRLNFAPFREPIEFERGTEGLQVELVRGHALTVWCLLPDELNARVLQYSLSRHGEPDADFVGFDDPWTPQPEATHQGLPAGRYTVRVRHAQTRDVLATATDVVLPPGNGGFECDVELDLRAKLAPLRLRLVERGAGPIDGETFVFVDQTIDAGLRHGTAIRGHEALLVVPARPLDVLVVAPAFRPLQLRGVTGAVDVALERWSVAPVTVEGIPELGERAWLKLSLGDTAADDAAEPSVGYDDGGGGGRASLSHVLGSSAATLVLEHDGPIELRAADAPRAVVATLLQRGKPESAVTVRPSVVAAGTAPVTLRVDPDEIRRALAGTPK
jgi:hypothetical protein